MTGYPLIADRRLAVSVVAKYLGSMNGPHPHRCRRSREHIGWTSAGRISLVLSNSSEMVAYQRLPLFARPSSKTRNSDGAGEKASPFVAAGAGIACQLIRQRRLLAASVTAILALALFGWLQCNFRKQTIQAYVATCTRPPFFFFHRPPSSLSDLFIGDEYSVAANGTLRLRGSPRIGIAQVCTVPRRDSRYLAALVDNHREYCLQHRYEYALATGGDGVWEKVTVLLDLIERELAKPIAGERLQWIL